MRVRLDILSAKDGFVEFKETDFPGEKDEYVVPQTFIAKEKNFIIVETLFRDQDGNIIPMKTIEEAVKLLDRQLKCGVDVDLFGEKKC